MKARRNTKISAGNLPLPLSTFIGREQEIGEVKRLLANFRLVTLTGTGGSGKTRLAIKIAEELSGEFKDGIWFIELASLLQPEFVVQTVASTLELREQAEQPLLDSLLNYLSMRQILLVLDNCEHLVAACARLAEVLLKKCPDLKIFATSREVLGINGEASWLVPPLSLPGAHPWKDPASVGDALKVYAESESVQLFVSRARWNSSDFELTAENGAWIAEICRRLDGIPLAIELAAARVRNLSVQEIAQRLDDRFHLLTGGSRTAPPRQQTLKSALDWSYTLLSWKEQHILQCLSLFAGGATLAAAEAVSAGEEIRPDEVLDALAHLIDKSLLMAETSGLEETRYHLLETIRQYALQKLEEAGTIHEAKDRFLNYFIRWAEAAEPHLSQADQLQWLEHYEAERDNLRAALEWCNADEKKVTDGMRLTVAYSRFCRLRGYLSEGRAHIASVLSRPGGQDRTEMRARALFWGASLAYLQSDYPATRLLGEESLALWRELNALDHAGLADTLDLLGELATEEGDYTTAPALFEEALQIFRKVADTRGVGDMLMQLGWAYMRMGEYDKVAQYMEEALGLFEEIGLASLKGFTLAGLGELAIRQHQLERATRFLEESLAIRRQLAHKWGAAASLGSLGWVALLQHDYPRMKRHLGESLAIRREIGDQGGIAWCLEKLAEARMEQSQFQEAAKLFGCAEALRVPIGSVIDPADQPEYDRLLLGLQTALGKDAFAALWAEGKATPLDAIISCALSDSSTSTRSEKEKFGGLTRREREVAAWIAQGKSNREISEAMTVSAKTIETYVTRILNKLGFESRVQIATWAVEKGLAELVRAREPYS